MEEKKETMEPQDTQELTDEELDDVAGGDADTTKKVLSRLHRTVRIRYKVSPTDPKYVAYSSIAWTKDVNVSCPYCIVQNPVKGDGNGKLGCPWCYAVWDE